MSHSTPEPFGVRVRHHPTRTIKSRMRDIHDQPIPDRVVPEHWTVDLPHQCEEWTIGTGKRGDVMLAVTRLADELKAAFHALAEQREFGEHP